MAKCCAKTDSLPLQQTSSFHKIRKMDLLFGFSYFFIKFELTFLSVDILLLLAGKAI